MDIKDILSVGLTVEDFDMLLEAIEALPTKGLAGEIMLGMLRITKEFEVSRAGGLKAQQDVQQRMTAFEKKAKAKEDDITILKSKIIQLKRLMMSEAAVKMASEIVNKNR